jgi:hypothetical protein
LSLLSTHRVSYASELSKHDIHYVLDMPAYASYYLVKQKAPLPAVTENEAKSSKQVSRMPNPKKHFRLAPQKRQAEMNVLPMEKQVQILNSLVERCSVRSTARLVGVEHKTVLRVLLRAGERCQQLLDEKMRNLSSRFIQVDEMHGYVQVRQKNLDPTRHDELIQGEQYVFIAIDAETKLISSFIVGKRNGANAYWLMKDLESRLANRVQLTPDGIRPYADAVDATFGTNIDFAMLVKVYSGDEVGRERYSPSEIVEARPIPVMGSPKPQRISTSHVKT